MSAGDRREQILDQATEIFGRSGYVGTTTDQIAQASGISQPYVVRMFGTKEKLFLEVVDRALATMMDAFRAVLADEPAVTQSADEMSAERDSAGTDADADPAEPGTPLAARLGAAFVGLVATKGVHRTLLQAFVSGNDPVIGDAARKGFVGVYTFLRDEAGFVPDEVNSFLAQGMLFSVLLGIELPAVFGQDPAADELMQVAFGDKCAVVLDLAGPGAA